MAWLPTKGSIRRHMIRQVGGSQAASWHKTPRARCTLSFPAASGRVSVSAWQSHATINQICGRKRRKWCGLTAASQWRKPNYTARRSTPYPRPIIIQHSFSLSPVLTVLLLPLTASFLLWWGFSKLFHALSFYESSHWRPFSLQSHTGCICSDQHSLHLPPLNYFIPFLPVSAISQSHSQLSWKLDFKWIFSSLALLSSQVVRRWEFLQFRLNITQTAILLL